MELENCMIASLLGPQRPGPTSGLQSLGVTPLGVDQFLNGRVVLDAADRSRLARFLASALAGPAVGNGNSREFQGGCNASSDLQRLGVSPPGANQFLTGQIVVSQDDRSKLATLVVLSFTPPIGSNKGSFLSGPDVARGIIAILIGLRGPTQPAGAGAAR